MLTPTDRIAHLTTFVRPVVEHRLERYIAEWVHHEGSIIQPITPGAELSHGATSHSPERFLKVNKRPCRQTVVVVVYIYFLSCTHTHTHTQIYIYIFVYILLVYKLSMKETISVGWNRYRDWNPIAISPLGHHT